MSKNKVLVLYAHPSQRRSEVNQPLFKACHKVEGVTAVDLYYEYPTYNINIDREQQRLIDHDVIVFQFPLYWYSTPSILKEWQDLVLEYGFAYGHDGTALHGKKFLCALTAGGQEEAYQTEGYNHFTIRELLQPLEQMATLTGMEYLAPFALFGARTAKEDGRIKTHVEAWQALLLALVEDRVDYDKASKVEKLCHCLDEIIVGGLR
ncbi:MULTISPECIES: NAD(P)H-dependent oxidoreductase [Vibrio]|uniref:NAD(P)H-dependent oxidoreductase n=1 Tax=Vibrio TaxID=662 RepID=UPI000810DCE0|nr:MULTISPECIES: NAD(P)H-dependent oxidoreductase [Vibrio]ANW26285.1 potassium transporter KefG [Vibrio coralliilyticus]NOH62294.1 flavodoxin family protein [Vibrio sp. RE88]